LSAVHGLGGTPSGLPGESGRHLVHIGGHVVLRVPGDDITGQEKAGLDASVKLLADRRNTVAVAADLSGSNGDAGSDRSQSEARRLTPTVSMRTKSAIAI
jgi:hypothetical protein